jgi:hypothetical protein
MEKTSAIGTMPASLWRPMAVIPADARHPHSDPREPFGGIVARLRREQTEPDLAGFRTFRPETREFCEIPRAHNLLSSDGAVHNHPVPADVLEDAAISGGRAPAIMFLRQTIDGNHKVQAPKRGHSAGICRTALVLSPDRYPGRDSDSQPVLSPRKLLILKVAGLAGLSRLTVSRRFLAEKTNSLLLSVVENISGVL